MVTYGLEGRVAIITGANNPWGIGAAAAFAFAREGAKVALVYKKIDRPFDPGKMDRNGVDRYYGANAGSADAVERKLREMGAAAWCWKATFPTSRRSKRFTAR